MAITALMVKELRGRTGAGMMDCKKALSETNGDMEAAIDLMRTSGAAKAAKKSGRIAAEGLVKVNVSADGKTATILEVNSETDFVTKGDVFIGFVDALGDLALKTTPANIEAFLMQTMENGDSLEKAREDIVASTGENVTIRRVTTVHANDGVIGVYKHGERIAVLTLLDGGDEDLAKDIAMHIAASKPECISADELSADILEREKAIFVEQAKESGKPDNIIEKMIGGRMKKFINEVTLSGQAFVKDPDTTVGALVKSKGATIKSFVRFEVGDGIEKKEENFADEVMAQVKG
ncbi:translation elongation factor Ts [bacterium endosymbiont of Bathymodiolus sp. 5 South]|jgi:elongation factor Ts|uniref:translation elongation factor Ts n=1 Tax=bacterium endosymbiont of Bathymodiolus sp. 5 South TaxID=1181670 RepID=UPI0010B610DC|nr:translation elongation factor Ts [bacterium endosymbiont of Bathymodiolus sp. 5 South]CAC9442806.1 Translation elongation factor Ts [uncultured Gammaproteobacteria bacterium]SHN90526.1 Translation elongation factor Ts [bacterium endosymbiont of Bathymodiolus sp. 5 South]SSC07482.1 Translation elongation factor Ts [bacterium endosymbiont of Bathymodiolus sp. 5 South]SSC09030.1 Translation elongation factor Ts [bacterium endosymbiont of Bathymodiolus sp. 5 South]VVH55442.1 Translation elongat